MCTLSIIPNDGQLIVTMNRDERRDRPESGEMHVTRDAAYPSDAGTGGTWFGFNRHGLILAVLNRYDVPQRDSTLSRGRFIPALLSASNIEEAMEKFTALHSKGDNPFELVLMSKGRILHVQWDGQRVERKNHDAKIPFFLTSSSEYTATAIPLRQKLFNEFLQSHPVNGRDATAILRDLHLSGAAGQENLSIFMQRESKHTKSITQAVLSSDGVAATYYPERQLATMAAQGIGLSKIPALKTHFRFQKPPGTSLKKGPRIGPH